MSRRSITITLICIACIVGMFTPFTTTVVPTWKLRVIDVQGNPCPRSHVNEGWGHYSLEFENIGGGEYRFTDNDGYVEFPERTIKASLAWRIVAPIIAFVMQLAHGSFGISAEVFSTGMVDGPWLNYKPGKPMPDKIVVDRCYPSKD